VLYWQKVLPLMLNALKPVSDLQRVQRFDDYDLTANRAGVLSSRQRWRFVGARLANHTLGVVTILFSFALIVNGLFLVPGPTPIALIFAVVMVIALISLILSVRPAFQKDVTTVKGILRKDFALALDSMPFEEIAIGPVRFYAHHDLYDVLDEEAIYQAYYLKRSQRAGGNLLLSVEMIAPATGD
jgi:hypothetical protein